MSDNKRQRTWPKWNFSGWDWSSGRFRRRSFMASGSGNGDATTSSDSGVKMETSEDELHGWMQDAIVQNTQWMDGSELSDDFDSEHDHPEWMTDALDKNKGRLSQLSQLFTTFIGLHHLQKAGTLCDITIKVEERSFKAHKVVLAASSEYFNVMFTKGFQESLEEEVDLKTGKAAAFEILLDFLYSGELKLTTEMLVDVFEIAHYLQVDVAMKECEHFINKMLKDQSLDIEVAIRLLFTAEKFDLDDMKKKCKKNLAKNFKPSELFVKHATAEVMEELLKRLDLPDEKQVFDTTVAWLLHDWENRQTFAPALFRKLRLGAVPVGHLSMTVFKSPNLYSVPECKQLIDKVMRLTDSTKPGDPPLHTVDYNLFATRTTVNGIVYIDRPACFYGPRIKKWMPLKTFPYLPEKDCKDTDDTCFNAKGNLYVSRGVKSCPRDLKCPQFLRLDILNNKWLTLAPMNHRRENPTIVCVGDKIFAIGGGVNTTFPEVYSIRENKWRNISAAWSLQHFILGPMSGVPHGGNVLVYAARKGEENLAEHSLYCYIADGDRSRIGDWYVLMSENHPVSDFTGLLTNEGKCYRVSGGQCKCEVKGCEWHQVCVHELVVSFTTRTATVGMEQDQAVIPARYRKKCFRINRDVYVIFCGRFYKVDRVKGTHRHAQRVLLEKWDHLDRLPVGLHIGKPYMTMLSFDKAKWL